MNELQTHLVLYKPTESFLDVCHFNLYLDIPLFSRCYFHLLFFKKAVLLNYWCYIRFINPNGRMDNYS